MKKLIVFSLMMMLLAVAVAPTVNQVAADGGLIGPGWNVSKVEL